jgi:hypothetical protein
MAKLIFFFSFFIGYFIYLHFKCYLLSHFSLYKSPIPSSLPLSLLGCSPPPPPSHSYLSALAFHYLSWVMKPPQDHAAPLPVMPDKAVLCYISIWSCGAPPSLPCSFSLVIYFLGALGAWLVDIVALPIGLHIPLTPTVLALTSPHSDQCLAVYI